MIGRGTRLCSDIKTVSPSKAYFERRTNDTSRQLYQDKQGFLIFDICNVFSFFKMKPDGTEDKSDQILSLNQKIFMEKVALYKAMQSHITILCDEDKQMYSLLRDSLVDEVKSLNKNYIGVQNSLKYVEKYSEVASWHDLNQQKFVEIKKYIAPNVIGELDIESARFFDYLSYRFSATKLAQNNKFAVTAKAIYALAAYLYDCKMHIGEVAEQKDVLAYIQTNDFLNKTTATDMENIRIRIRELMKYIEREVFEPIISDFDDHISSYEDAPEDPIDFSTTVDDFKSYEEKLKFYVNTHTNNTLINKIRSLSPYSEENIENLKKEIIQFAKSQDEYDSLFDSNKDLICFIRKNTDFIPEEVEKFISLQKEEGRTEAQINYIRALLTYINKNGKFERQDLLKEELHFAGLFDSIQINSLLKDIEKFL